MASASQFAGGAGSLYQEVNVCAERKRKAPLKSTTRIPASRSAGAISLETSCGVAKNAVAALLAVMASRERGRRGASPQHRSWGNRSDRHVAPFVSRT